MFNVHFGCICGELSVIVERTICNARHIWWTSSLSGCVAEWRRWTSRQQNYQAVVKHLAKYTAVKSGYRKAALEILINAVKVQGGRFLKNDDEGNWRQVSVQCKRHHALANLSAHSKDYLLDKFLLDWTSSNEETAPHLFKKTNTDSWKVSQFITYSTERSFPAGTTSDHSGRSATYLRALLSLSHITVSMIQEFSIFCLPTDAGLHTKAQSTSYFEGFRSHKERSFSLKDCSIASEMLEHQKSFHCPPHLLQASIFSHFLFSSFYEPRLIKWFAFRFKENVHESNHLCVCVCFFSQHFQSILLGAGAKVDTKSWQKAHKSPSQKASTTPEQNE